MYLKVQSSLFPPFYFLFLHKINSFGVFGVFSCYRMNNDTELAPITLTRCLYAQVTSALDVYRKHLFSALTLAVRALVSQHATYGSARKRYRQLAASKIPASNKTPGSPSNSQNPNAFWKYTCLRAGLQRCVDVALENSSHS